MLYLNKEVMMNKKAQGLSINVIIIVAIALIVLVVLVAIFTGRLGNFSRGLDETSSCEQVCSAKGYTGPFAAEGDTVVQTDLQKESYDKPLAGRDGQGRQCYCQPTK
jgi:hypothetical protein